MTTWNIYKNNQLHATVKAATPLDVALICRQLNNNQPAKYTFDQAQ